MKRREHLSQNVIWLSIASMFNDMSGEIVARALPIFLSATLGVGYGLIGLIEGVADTTSALLKLIVGRYSDKGGSRKRLAFFGYALTAVARPMLFFANSWLLPLLSRFVDRAGKGVRTSPRDALIADSVSPESRGRAFGFHRALDPLGAVLGALIGAGALYAIQSDPWNPHAALTVHVFKWLVVIATVPTILSCVIVYALVKDISRAKSAANANPAPLFGGKTDQRFKRLLIVLVIFTLGSSSDAFLILRATSEGVSPAEVFLLIAGFNLVTTLSAYPAGILSDRLSRKALMRAGWLLYALVYLGFALADSQTVIWGLFIIYGLFYGLTEGVEKALVTDLVPAEKRGTAFGWYNAAIGITVLPASLIAGILWQGFGPQAPFFFGAAMALIAFVGLSLIGERRPDK